MAPLYVDGKTLEQRPTQNHILVITLRSVRPQHGPGNPSVIGPPRTGFGGLQVSLCVESPAGPGGSPVFGCLPWKRIDR